MGLSLWRGPTAWQSWRPLSCGRAALSLAPLPVTSLSSSSSWHTSGSARGAAPPPGSEPHLRAKHGGDPARSPACPGHAECKPRDQLSSDQPAHLHHDSGEEKGKGGGWSQPVDVPGSLCNPPFLRLGHMETGGLATPRIPPASLSFV